MIDVQLLPLQEYVLVQLLVDTNAMLELDQLVFLFRVQKKNLLKIVQVDVLVQLLVDTNAMLAKKKNKKITKKI